MRKILHLSPYSVVPPQYGGAIRIYNLCREISKHCQVVQFAQQVHRSNLSWSLSPVIQQITPTYVEYSCRNPLNVLLYGIISSKLGYPFTFHSEVLRTSAPQWLYKQIAQASIINVEHPWQFAWVYRQVKQRKPIIVTAHNVESVLCSAERLAQPKLIAKPLAQKIERQERFAMQYASRIFTMSSQDTEQLVDRYNISPEKCVVIPNGVDCDAFTPANSVRRQQRKNQLGLSNQCIVMFAGSTHSPNREAVRQIIRWAEGWTDKNIHFLIVGSIGREFTHIRQPNMTFTGLVEDTRPYFEASDIAINPMLSGSGTNLKQLEYMAMGLPTIATPIGMRGISIVNEQQGYISQLEDFPNCLNRLITCPEAWHKVGIAARKFVETEFDWKVVAEKAIEIYKELEAETDCIHRIT